MDISDVIFHLRDLNRQMVKAWQQEFAPHNSTVKVRTKLLWKTIKMQSSQTTINLEEVKNIDPQF